jgi:hypothetical protein
MGSKGEREGVVTDAEAPAEARRQQGIDTPAEAPAGNPPPPSPEGLREEGPSRER